MKPGVAPEGQLDLEGAVLEAQDGRKSGVAQARRRGTHGNHAGKTNVAKRQISWSSSARSSHSHVLELHKLRRCARSACKTVPLSEFGSPAPFHPQIECAEQTCEGGFRRRRDFQAGHGGDIGGDAASRPAATARRCRRLVATPTPTPSYRADNRGSASRDWMARSYRVPPAESQPLDKE